MQLLKWNIKNRMRRRSLSSLINAIYTAGEVDWNDRIGLQARFKNAQKGWKVEVEWRPTPFGAGLFAKQEIPKDTILRIGRYGVNLIQFKSSGEMKTFCCNHKEDGTPDPAMVSYVADYFYGFDCNAERNNSNGTTSTSTNMSGSNSGSNGGTIGDTNTNTNTTNSNMSTSPQWWYGIWVPGNGLNHNENPNTIYKCASGQSSVGIDLVALTDIKNGDELVDDYRRHGPPPPWVVSFIKEFKVCMNFAGCNDFV